MTGVTVQREPALTFVTILSTVAALVVAFAHLTPHQSAAVGVIAVALGGLITAALAVPRNVAVIAAAGGAVLTGLAGFGLHISDHQISVLVAAVGLALGYILRLHLTPNGGG
jgi:poly(3-hydroxybutyrate) depolymerase